MKGEELPVARALLCPSVCSLSAKAAKNAKGDVEGRFPGARRKEQGGGGGEGEGEPCSAGEQLVGVRTV